MIHKDTILKRYSENPILSPRNFPYGYADVVFNPGQCMFNGKVLLLLAVRLSTERSAKIHVAESADGINFEIHEKPLFTVNMNEEEIGQLDEHPIDCRVTQIGDTYYIVRPGSSRHGTIGMLYKTTDFRSVEFIDVIALPNNRVPCLFPEKINGMYYRLDRPLANNVRGEIWISRSPDLVHWGHHRFLLESYQHWCWEKIGPTPPIRTEKGWLEIIHGVYRSCSVVTYSIGAVMLDLENPEKVIGKTEGYILTPEEPYEYMGKTPSCVFTTGAVVDWNTRKLKVYYGAADTCIGLAEGNLDEIIDACLN